MTSEERLRTFETAYDLVVVPETYIVARIDGRSFTRLTKELNDFDRPFDERFHKLMIGTTTHLMSCGFNVVFGYTQSDEISLLFALNEDAFGRTTRKFNSVLAAEASAFFSLEMGQLATFDCRLSLLPNASLVGEYFRWRADDAHRNALSSHCYWRLREDGLSAHAATQELSGATVAEKNELLFSRFDVNFNELPTWQKRGVGLWWETFEREGLDPRTNTTTLTTRRRIHVERELPLGDEFEALVQHHC